MIKNTDNSKIPVDSARSPYSLFKSKVPLTYSTGLCTSKDIS